MTRLTIKAYVTTIAALPLGAALAAQIVTGSGRGGAVGQTRDSPPPPPTERRIPVGTSTISGTLTAADTGKRFAALA